MFDELKTDFLVIGSGIAGLVYAIKAAESGKVIIVSKSKLIDTNTRHAQGGIAAVSCPTDSIESHFVDTYKAGRELSDPDIVKMVVTEGPDLINELIEWGVEFDKNPDGSFNLAREGGHSESRVYHHKDNTGQEIQKVLINKIELHPNITVLENHFAIDIITQHHFGETVTRAKTDIECFGAYVLNSTNNKIFAIAAKITMIATGGAGSLYQSTTNPLIATGDGIAMVYRAKGIIENMEFVQFHPTSLYNPIERPSFLITEALRGHGAYLTTIAGVDFMKNYDERGSLAPRDIVAKAIDYELKKSGDDYVLLNTAHLYKEELVSKFPNIYKKCLSIGIDITKQAIPVVPAAHYFCGGIKVNKYGLSNIKNLYASGECASTGLHGANRLASNSLIEALVFSNNAAKHSVNSFLSVNYKADIPPWNESGVVQPYEKIFISQVYREINQLMTNYVGIVRSDNRLERALKRLKMIYLETDVFYKKSKLSPQICELRNMINVGYLVIKSAQNRKKSIGLHYNIDCP